MWQSFRLAWTNCSRAQSQSRNMVSSPKVIDQRVLARSAASDPSLVIMLIVGSLVVLRFWFLPLANSYWLDETFIVSLIRDTFGQTISHAFETHQSVPFC